MTKRLVHRPERYLPQRVLWIMVGRRLRARRIELGYEVDHVADELGISPSVYDHYEAGSDQAPALLLARLADLFVVPVLWFFKDMCASEEDGAPACLGPPRSYRIATVDERIGFLAASFRELDLEGQQYLLAIADALGRSNRKRG